MLAWHLRLFGQVGLHGSGTSITSFPTKRSAKLLVLLALSRNGFMLRDDLCNILWPDDFLDANRLRLRQELARLKKSLGDASYLVKSTGQTVQLVMSDLDSDIGLLKRGKLAEDDAERVLTDELMPGWDDPLVIAERQGALPYRISLAIDLAMSHLSAARYEKTLEMSQAGLTLDPQNEDLKMLAVKAHAGMGSLVNAVSEYRRYDAQQGAIPFNSSDSELPLMRIPQERMLPSAPVPVDRLYGRKEELDRLNSYVLDQDQRLISIVGAGGIGKTRLAIQVAQKTESTGFVSFAEMKPDDNPVAFLADRTMEGITIKEPMAQLKWQFYNKPALLILDNLEHLDDPGSFVLGLLNEIPTLRLIVTSRRPMKVAGEQVLALSPLTADESVAMLNDLAAVQPADEDTGLRVVVQRCGGLPLALRLAAARLRYLSPSELGDELRNSQSFQAKVPDLPERQRNAAAMFDLSIRSLDEETRHLLRAMVEFPSGLIRDLAKRLTASTIDTHLEALLDEGLIWLEDDARPLRFRILEPIRQHLLADADDMARLAFVRAMASKASEFPEGRKPSKPEDVRTLNQETANFRLAIQHALSIDVPSLETLFDKFWRHEITTGYAVDIAKVAEQMLAMPELSARARGAALMAIAWRETGRVNRSKACELIEDAKQAFTECGELGEAWSAELLLTELNRYSQPEDEVLPRYQGVLDWVQSNDPEMALTVLSWRGRVHLDNYRWAAAADDLGYVFNEAKRLGFCGTIVLSGLSLMLVYDALDRRTERDQCVSDVGAALASLHVPQHEAVFYQNLSTFALQDGKLAEAEKLARLALEAASYTDNAHYVGPIRNTLARVLIQLGKVCEAHGILVANASAIDSHYWRVVVGTLATLAELNLSAGRQECAKESSACMSWLVSHWRPILAKYELDIIDKLESELGSTIDRSYSEDEIRNIVTRPFTSLPAPS